MIYPHYLTLPLRATSICRDLNFLYARSSRGKVAGDEADEHFNDSHSLAFEICFSITLLCDNAMRKGMQ